LTTLDWSAKNAQSHEKPTTGGGCERIALCSCCHFDDEWDRSRSVPATQYRARAWDPNLIQNNVYVKNNSCYDTRVFSHYLYSQGKYASALAMGDTLFETPSTLPIQIPSDLYWVRISPHENRAPASDGLLYTGTCARCDPTETTQSGELTCWCVPSASVELPTLSAYQDPRKQFLASYFAYLYVDQDRDSVMDHLFRGGGNIEQTGLEKDFFPPPAPAPPVRYQFLWNSMVELDFEDSYKNGEADFNDYIALLEFRTCFPERYPDQFRPAQSGQCHDPCANNRCPEQDLSKTNERWAARVAIDAQSSETRREATGRLLRLTVVGYEDFLVSNRKIAICPTVNLAWPRPRLATESADLTTTMDYGSAVCGGKSNQSGLPICAAQHVAQTMPISFRRDETVAPACSSKSLISDIHETRSASKCGPDLFVSHYEVPLGALDAQLSDASLHYAALSDQDLVQSIESVDLYFFHDILTPDFQCPSGVNVDLGSVHPDVAHVTKITLSHGEPALDVASIN
jgi:hypothetical protein